jgi:hypothetical protein
MTPNKDLNLYSKARNAVGALMHHYSYGAYRVIKDPEGAVSLWAVEGKPGEPFSISFVDRGRVYNRIEDVPQDFLKPFLEYVQINSTYKS